MDTPRFIQVFEDRPPRLVTGALCVSKDHERPTLAVATAHMVQGQTPYCLDCAARALGVYQAFGAHLHVEPLEPTVLEEVTAHDRAIELED